VRALRGDGLAGACEDQVGGWVWLMDESWRDLGVR